MATTRIIQKFVIKRDDGLYLHHQDDHDWFTADILNAEMFEDIDSANDCYELDLELKNYERCKVVTVTVTFVEEAE